MKSIYLEAIDTRREIDDLYELIKLVWRQYYGQIMGEGKVEAFLSSHQSKTIIQQDIATEKTTYYFVRLKDTHEIIGYLAFHIDENVLNIDKFYLIYTVRGQGLSNEVMSYLEETAAKQGANQLSLWVINENKMSMRILKHKNYNVKDERMTTLPHGYLLKETQCVKEI